MKNNVSDAYIDEFRIYLHQLSDKEQQDVIEFYQEYIIDANLQTNDAIINELGTPKHLARKVLADYSIKMSEENYQNFNNGQISSNERFSKNLKMIGLVILALMASPVAILIAIILIPLILLFIGLGVFFILLFLFLVAMSVVGGIGAIFIGLSVIFQSFGTTIFYTGVGLLILGVDFFLIPIIVALLKWGFSVIVIFFRWLGKKLLHGRKTPMKGEQKDA
jgi:Predicted membrane protein